MKKQHKRVQLSFSKPSRTLQAHKDDCDINNIMKKYRQTGVLPSSSRLFSYGDFSNVNDFLTAQDQLLQAQAAFDALPATIRKFFDNEPANFLQFFEDPSNAAKARELGLINPLVPEPSSTNLSEVPKS